MNIITKFWYFYKIDPKVDLGIINKSSFIEFGKAVQLRLKTVPVHI